MPCQSFQSMVSYLPGAGKRSLPESRERPFPEARTYVREKYMGRRSASGCRTNTGELFWAGRGTGSFGDSRSPVFRLSFRPDVRLRPCSLPGWSVADAVREQPVFREMNPKGESPFTHVRDCSGKPTALRGLVTESPPRRGTPQQPSAKTAFKHTLKKGRPNIPEFHPYSLYL